MELRHYIRVALNYLWLIGLATLIGGGGAFFLSTVAPPIYEATTTLKVNPGGDPRTDLGVAVRSSESIGASYVAEIQAPFLLNQVAARLGLDLTASQIASMVAVVQVRESQLIRISAENGDPALAQALAQAVAQVFIDWETGQQQARFQAGLADIEAQIATLDTSVDQAQKALASIGDSLDSGNAGLPDFARLERARLESRLSRDQTRLSILLQSAEEFRLAMARYTDYVTIFSPAELPTRPARPQPLRNAALGLATGVLVGVTLAFLLDYLDDTIRTPDDLKQATPAGVLGAVPRLRGADGQVTLVAVEQPLAPVAEAFRNLRTSIQFSSVDERLRTLLVTSPLPSDGKTFTASNLATVMAQGGQSVILVDCDLRHPTQHRVFGVPREPGVTAALLNPEAWDGVLQGTAVEGLRVVTTGARPPNPAELLGSQTFLQFVDWLKGQADLVILDSPPVLAVTDATVLSTLVDGTVLVVDCGQTRKPAAAQAAGRLLSVGGRLLGVVMNRVSRGADGYYGYYYDYYSGSEGASEEAAGEGSAGRGPRGIARLFGSRRRRRRSRRRSSSARQGGRQVEAVE